MTEFENQLLQHLQKQADQLTALALSQSQTTQQLTQLSVHQRATSAQQNLISNELLKIQSGMGEVLKALSKEPSGESLESTLKAALQPLETSLDKLITSFNSLSNISRELSKQLPPPPKQ